MLARSLTLKSDQIGPLSDKFINYFPWVEPQLGYYDC